MKNGKGLLISPFTFNGGIPDRVQALFADLSERPDKTVEYSMEIIKAGMTGNIDFSRKFNLYGYCYKINEKEGMSAVKKQMDKETYIDYDNSDFEGTFRSGGVQSNSIKAVENSFEELEDDNELMFAVDMISKLHTELLVQEGINLPFLIKRALVGVPQAIAGLKKVCEEFEIIGEYVKVVLEAGAKGVDIESLALC